MRSPRSPRTATKSSPHLPQLEKACAQQRRPNAAKNKLINLKKNVLKKRAVPGLQGGRGVVRCMVPQSVPKRDACLWGPSGGPAVMADTRAGRADPAAPDPWPMGTECRPPQWTMAMERLPAEARRPRTGNSTRVDRSETVSRWAVDCSVLEVGGSGPLSPLSPSVELGAQVTGNGLGDRTGPSRKG